MKILISNDDGIYAKGIRVLHDALKKIAETIVIAPDRNRSGTSHSLTLDNPIRTHELETNRISVEGTPTDCVHLAITGLIDHPLDMVVSGINEGSNLGDDVLYSGTVAAAIEGRYLGLPAVAISLVTDFSPAPHYYETAAEVALRLVQKVTQEPLPVSTILNVNVPNIPFEALRGFEITRLGTRHRAEKMVPSIDPRGHPIYWVGPVGPEQDGGPGTDFHAIRTQHVSITPLTVDFTHYQAFDALSKWVTGL